MGVHRQVTLVIPVKRLDRAKTRLKLSSQTRAQVALDLMRHTLTIATSTASVDLVLVVSDDPIVSAEAKALRAEVVHEHPQSGLNQAARLGRETARRKRPGQDIAIMVCDLPRLTREDLSKALAEFRVTGRPLMVADHRGSGTTMLVHGYSDNPPILFGPLSAFEHAAAGFTPARGSFPGLRHDLDTVRDQPRSHQPSGEVGA